jgi:WS/DGAT/MGAT family acyltransferase
MDRLSALDTEFLHLEDDTSPMHIAAVCVFAGPAPSLTELTDLLESKLHELPRYRQVIRTVPLELGRPIWVDDRRFRLDYHVHRTALPSPGGAAELDDLMGRLMAHPLNRSRPLWEAWLVEGLSDDRWALVFKVHHCMVDGVAGVHLLEAFLDVSPDTPPGTVRPWRAQPEPSPLGKVVGSWVGLAGDVIPWGRRIATAASSPIDAVRDVAAISTGLGSFLAHLVPAPGNELQGRIGPHRRWSHVTLDLSDVALVRRRLGGTVNDVLLACVTAGHRALLEAHGDDPSTAVVRTAIPVSTRDWGTSGSGNRVSTLLAELPVGQPDPLVRLATVREFTTRLKASSMASVADTFFTLADLAPPLVVGPISRLAIRLEHRRAQRSITTITTNVPGPPFPLYCLGREMIEQLPYVGLTDGVRVTTAIVSYNGHITVGVTGDEDSVPDVGVATAAIGDALAELVRLARRRKDRTR